MTGSDLGGAGGGNRLPAAVDPEAAAVPDPLAGTAVPGAADYVPASGRTRRSSCPPHLVLSDGPPLTPEYRVTIRRGKEARAVEHQERPCTRCDQRAILLVGRDRDLPPGWTIEAEALGQPGTGQ